MPRFAGVTPLTQAIGHLRDAGRPAARTRIAAPSEDADSDNNWCLLDLPDELLEKIWAAVDNRHDQTSVLLSGSRRLQQLWDERWPQIMRFSKHDDATLLRLFKLEDDKRAVRALRAGAHRDDKLIQAAWHGLVGTTEYVLEQAAACHWQPGRSSYHVDSAFMAACQQGNADIAAMLLQRGSDARPHVELELGLFEAARWGHTGICRLLLDRYGVDVHAYDGEALYQAAAAGHVSTVQLLLQHGADVNTRIVDLRPSTPLAAAASNGHSDVIDAMVAQGCVPAGQISGVLADVRGDPIMAEVLAPGIDKASVYDSALMDAARTGQTRRAIAAIRMGADVGCDPVRSPLAYAMMYGHYSTALELLKHGAPVPMSLDWYHFCKCAGNGWAPITALMLSWSEACAWMSLRQLQYVRRRFGEKARVRGAVARMPMGLRLRFLQREIAALLRYWGNFAAQ